MIFFLNDVSRVTVILFLKEKKKYIGYRCKKKKKKSADFVFIFKCFWLFIFDLFCNSLL